MSVAYKQLQKSKQGKKSKEYNTSTYVSFISNRFFNVAFRPWV